MAWPKFKWRVILVFFILNNNFVKPLPIKPLSDVKYVNHGELSNDDRKNNTKAVDDIKRDDSRLLNSLRPGQQALRYIIEITLDGVNQFRGRAVIDVTLTEATRDDPMEFNFDDVTVTNVVVARFTSANIVDSTWSLEDGVLEVTPSETSSLLIVIVEYTGVFRNGANGLYLGRYDRDTYVAMNLHPTNARRVFPCIDEPNVHTTISFNFAGVNNYQHVISNSILAETQTDANQVQFTPLPGVSHLWGMVAHNLNAVNIPITNVVLYARPGRSNQDAQANVAINNFFSTLNDWTGKEYESIIANQEGRLHIMAMPDIDKEWYALSSICIWEPYVLMETAAAVSQRKTGLIKIAEAIARQWFGFVMVPANWRYQWVVTGLGSYAAHHIVKDFQTDPVGVDESLIDMNAVFVSDIIQESLLHDAYTSALPLEPNEDLFDEDIIRDNINGLVKTKAPAILHMLSMVLSQNPETDYVRDAASALLQTDALSNINSRNLYDTLISFWNSEPNKIIDDIMDFLDPWVLQNNYPLLRVDLRQGGVVLTQERFGYSSRPQINYMIPITYTTSINPNFDDIRPIMVMETTQSFNMVLDEEDWVLFNIQGQGYYRVNYDNELWERIIEALEDPDQREEIHPINRATLVDDALNLARAGKVDYDIAFRVVLTMEHETEYVVWKAFVRSMEFLRVRLLAYVDDDEDLDPDIYLRMVRRTVVGLENELSFTPELNVNEPAMTSLARGLVMNHACRVGYQPCIAAAIDWFRDPNNKDSVNPNIPADLRSAVYCANVMSGGEEERELLFEYLDTLNNAHERVVVLESLACSQDNNFIQSYLDQTIAANSPYNTEERSRIFKAVVSSTGPKNVRIALNFISQRTTEIRNMYGGADKLEDLVHTVARHLGDRDMTNDFVNWVNSLFSDLDESLLTAERAREQALQDALWDNIHLDYVYEWIDENDAHTVMVSMLLISLGLLVAVFNQF